MSEELDRHQQDRTYLSRYGDREVQGNVDADAYTGDGTFLAFTSINIQERSSTPKPTRRVDGAVALRWHGGRG